jgi:AraC family transcriptional regulator of adaptative response / DNA-3-methyladenine glycosylase II
MSITDAARYRAIASKDARFDGRFFTGVVTTGVYCRPVCPARVPLRRNVRFFVTAAAAEAEGFRPCLRCRPEASPGTPAWLGTSATVSRALRHIEAGALDRGGVEDLAARLGVGERQLRRLFLEHVGAAPLAVAQTRRVQVAKKLIDETDLPMTRIALDAGFPSVRRFNATMQRVYGRHPSALRRARRAAAATGSRTGRWPLRLQLSYRPPLEWRRLMAYLGPYKLVSNEDY